MMEYSNDIVPNDKIYYIIKDKKIFFSKYNINEIFGESNFKNECEICKKLGWRRPREKIRVEFEFIE
jgi:hypothetical protein